MPCEFFEMLEWRWARGARVCVGLDSEWEKLPAPFREEIVSDSLFDFNKQIIDATKDIALAYKPNIAFYNGDELGHFREAFQEALRLTTLYIRSRAPEVPIILDAKRADIGNTNRGYVLEAFRHFKAHALTINPLFGLEANRPFLDEKGKGIIVLCKTSNKGSDEFQDLPILAHTSGVPMAVTKKMYEIVAEEVAKDWNYNGNCALVVGATYPEELGKVRTIVGDMWILIPGIGKQGGDLELSVKNGANSNGSGIIINSSSGIIFASSDYQHFAKAAYEETKRLADGINAALGSMVDKKA